jgi:hypothetical protein
MKFDTFTAVDIQLVPATLCLVPGQPLSDEPAASFLRVKVKFTLEQGMKAQRGSRSILVALLFL